MHMLYSHEVISREKGGGGRTWGKVLLEWSGGMLEGGQGHWGCWGRDSMLVQNHASNASSRQGTVQMQARNDTNLQNLSNLWTDQVNAQHFV